MKLSIECSLISIPASQFDDSRLFSMLRSSVCFIKDLCVSTYVSPMGISLMVSNENKDEALLILAESSSIDFNYSVDV